MGALHSRQTTTEGIHSSVAYSYADATARTTASGFVAADVGKICVQVDEDRYFVLNAITPVWVEITNEGALYQLWTSSTFSSTQNNLAPTNWTSAQYANISLNNTSGSTFSVTGLTSGIEGRIARLFNTGTGSISIAHESGSSTAANRFTNAGGAAITLPVGSCAVYIYDAATSRWKHASGNAAHLNIGTTANTVAAGDDSRFVRNVETVFDVWHEVEMHRVTTLEMAPFNMAVILAGVLNSASYPITDTIQRGVNIPITVRSNTAVANQGARFYTENLNMVMAGGSYQKSYVFVARIMFAGISTRNMIAGFHDSVNQTEPVDGIYFYFNGTNIVGKHSSNSSRTATATSYVPTLDLEYEFRIETDGATNITTFIIFEEGAQVWTDTVSTNHPSLVARAVGVAVILTCSAAAITNIAALSYLAFGTRQAYLAKTLG
jgi:hypothetical protein